jgi:hypothetical protein
MKLLRGLVLVLLLTFALSGCTASEPIYHTSMESISPWKVSVSSGFFQTETFWFTKEFRMNDNEYVFYAPPRLSTGEDVFINTRECYWIRTKTVSGSYTSFSWREATSSDLKNIFNR